MGVGIGWGGEGWGGGGGLRRHGLPHRWGFHQVPEAVGGQRAGVGLGVWVGKIIKYITRQKEKKTFSYV